MAAKRVFEVNESSVRKSTLFDGHDRYNCLHLITPTYIALCCQIVDLKAELIRKESQFKREKLGSTEKNINRQPKVSL